MNVQIRPFAETDSVAELTSLLHRSYKRLADMGLRFVATYQDEGHTKELVEKGECFVAVSEGKIIGTILVYDKDNDEYPEFYKRDDVAVFGKFAVEPMYQNCGVGEKLMEHIEQYAISKGMKELALDTSDEAKHLIDYYKKRGFRFIRYHKWGSTNYRSMIMSKKIG